MSPSLYYQSFARHLVAVDSIIFGFSENQLQLLVTRRELEHHRGQWSLMGGFVEENESVDAAARRILEELTGLKNIYLEQLYTYGDSDRDDGARVISVAYYALINMDAYNEESGNRYQAKWFAMDEIPQLVFDHNTMVEKALKRLRRKTIIQPVGFELLPEKFTLTQLQTLYEAIHGQELDKRNFRKKILSMNVLQKLDEKDKNSSRRGAFLFCFDKQKYHEMMNGDGVFDFKY
ncbi:MAG: NUDIX hydrolase [Bacteroidales bacterium]